MSLTIPKPSVLLEDFDTQTVTSITGRVSRLFCQKPTFSAGVLTTESGTDGVKFSVKGWVKPGEFVTIHGQYNDDPKYGRQFVGQTIVSAVPVSVDGIAVWLSWNASGIGTVRANKLVDTYGVNLPSMLATKPGEVAKTTGIPLDKITDLADKWSRSFATIGVETELASFNLTRHQVELLVDKWKGSAASVIKDDPYLLLGVIDGMGWKTVDEIAAKVGISADDPKRIRAAMTSVVREAISDGHTCLHEPTAFGVAVTKLESRKQSVKVTTEMLEKAVAEAVELKHLVRLETETANYLASGICYSDEKYLWKFLKNGNRPNPFINPEEADIIADMYQTIDLGKKGKVTLDESQLAAVRMAAKSRVCCITGGAGAGKTLVARAIFKMYRDNDTPVEFAAPTGKAARRLSEVVGKQATTIHKLLGNAAYKNPESGSLPSGVLIVDEASMIDSRLAYALCKASSDETNIIFIGDDNQLSPVGAGAFLRDILAHELVPVSRLNKCHRQAGTLKRNCFAILEGIVEPSANDEDPSPWMVHQRIDTAERLTSAIEALYEKYLPLWGIDPLVDTQFLTAMHKGAWGTKYINKLLQYLNQKKRGTTLTKPNPKSDDRPLLMVGDKVIQTSNNYGLGVMNGQQGIVDHVSPLVVAFDNRIGVTYPQENEGQVELGYCITPHKAQGSEWPCAVVICPKAHSFMQHRNWLYTGVTRSQRLMILIGDPDGITRAAERIETSRRQTLLSVFATFPEVAPA